jgi:putative nucleotidyltransferase with HDIG domain
MKPENIERIVDSIDRLPTLPAIYTRLSNLLAQSNSTVRTIADAISEDPTIAAKILRVVNSVFYGFPKKIGNVQRAVVILGLNEIKSLVLATSIVKTFDQLEWSHEFDITNFWEHSVGCAVSAKVVAEAAYLRNPEDVFTGGLLHDIGKLIHALYLPQEFSRVIAEVEHTGIPMIESEQGVFGFGHTQTGRILAEKWHFPDEIVTMIAYHHMHGGDLFQLSKEAAAVHLGNTLCIAFGLGSAGEKRVPIVNQKAWEILGLQLSDLESLSGRIQKLFRGALVILE